MVKEVTDGTFQSEVMDAAGLVLVDFSATWCGPCRALAPVLDELAVEMRDEVKFVKIDVDLGARTARMFKIRGVPALLFFHNGRKVGELVGFRPKDSLRVDIQGLKMQIQQSKAAA